MTNHNHPYEHPHHHEHQTTESSRAENHVSLAFRSTWHCLIGCGIGEVVGMVISTSLGWGNALSIAFSVLLGFIFGFALGVRPLLQAGIPIKKALQTVLAAEGLSIAVMEAFEVATEILTPGVMNAHLNDAVFWFGMALALVVGFIAAFPVNLYFIKKGIRHQH